jgi:hypothetical protein
MGNLLRFVRQIYLPLIILFFDLTYFRSLGEKSKNNSVHFLVQMEQDNLLSKFTDL